MQLEFRSDDDDRAARVIDPFAEQVLAETPALALEHVAEGLQRTIARTSDGAAVAPIVEESIDGFLEHPFFVADNDFRSLELQQILQPVVAVDDTPIEIVKVGGGKASAFEGDERAQVRRNHRQHNEDHPFGPALGRLQALEKLDAFGNFLADL